MAGTKRQPLREVQLRDDIECRSCGAVTDGPAICRLCFEAITELRSLAEDFYSPKPEPVAHAPRPFARQGSNGSRRPRS